MSLVQVIDPIALNLKFVDIQVEWPGVANLPSLPPYTELFQYQPAGGEYIYVPARSRYREHRMWSYKAVIVKQWFTKVISVLVHAVKRKLLLIIC